MRITPYPQKIRANNVTFRFRMLLIAPERRSEPRAPVPRAMALHFDLSTPNFLIQEDMPTGVPWRWDEGDGA
jgi:hypothetical protein